MHRIPYQIILLIHLLLLIDLKAQMWVNDYSDEPDDNIEDGIWRPQTLRAAIQNANREGVPVTIKIAGDGKTIQLKSDLPEIIVPVDFDGKGLILEPATPSGAEFGLQVLSKNSIVRNVMIQNFTDYGLVWKGNDGLIEMVVSRYNGTNLYLSNAKRNTIGGTLIGYYSNYFYGAKQGESGYGISLRAASDDNIIQYCSIGMDDNYKANPNSRDGISIVGSNRTIIKSNTISGNNYAGINIGGGSITFGTVIESNRIGTDNLGGDTVPNRRGGIHITTSSFDTIRNNTISGNINNGIFIGDKNCNNIIIENNKVGTDKRTNTALPNSVGIRLNGYEHTVVNNVISGNIYDGISTSASNSYIANNIIGLDAEQKVAIPNGGNGITVMGSNIIIGDITGGNSNVVAGNKGCGIAIYGPKEKNIKISHNAIGTNKDSSLKFPNMYSGIFITQNLSEVFITNNLISEQGEYGIRIERNVVIFSDTTKPHLYQKPYNVEISDNRLRGKFGASGISVFNADSIYIYGNLIEGAARDGISIENDSTHYVEIFHNIIGPDFGSSEEQKIGMNGIYIKGASDVYIGGGDIIEDFNKIRNCNLDGILIYSADTIVVDGNDIRSITLHGISVRDLSSNNITIRNNIIGPDEGSPDDDRIGGNGINIREAYNVLIGSQVLPSDSNVIRNCNGYGLAVNDFARMVNYFGNTMLDNKLGGIALGNLSNYYTSGASNDIADADNGSNGLQNTPDIEVGEAKGSEMKLKGKLIGKNNTPYRIDVYMAKKLDETEQEKTQGSIYLGWFNVETNAQGEAIIDTSWSNDIIQSNSGDFEFITVTASGTEGTSQFSILTMPDLFVDVAVKIDTSKTKCYDDGNIELVAEITNKGTKTATNIIVKDTIPSFDLKEATISRGIIIVNDSIITATIPPLAKGEIVTYYTNGKSKITGTHNRKIFANPVEVDKYPENNKDSIALSVNNVELYAPIIKSPKNNVQDIDNPLTLIWYKVENAIAYHLQVAEGSFTSVIKEVSENEIQSLNLIVNDSAIADTIYKINNLIGDKTDYLWCVAAIIPNPSGKFWSDTLMFTTADVTGTDETISINDNIELYPNPVNDRLYINAGALQPVSVQNEPINLEIFNVFGQSVLRRNEFPPFQNTIDVSSLNAGTYYMFIRNAGSRIVTKQFTVFR